MDEYILWTAEDSKAGVGALTSSAIESNTAIRQNNIPIPTALHDRTAEDFWKDIQKGSTTDVAEADMHHQQQQRQVQPQYPRQRQATFGEMTLADFLVRTGIVTDDPDTGPQTPESSSFCPSTSSASIVNGLSSSVDAFPSLPRECLNFHHHHLQHQQMLQHTESTAAANRTFEPSSIHLTTNSPVYDGLVDNTALVPDGFANTLALSPSFSDYPLPSRKRFSSTVAEKSMERRQKRMIKNRESAARSRARKQAYTVELEAEVSLLKKENASLKLQQGLQARPPGLAHMQNTKMHVLRRTQSL